MVNWNNNQNFGWRLVFNIWFLVHGLSNEKDTSWVFLWNFIPMRIVCLSLDTERRQFKEKFPTHDSTMKQILVFETPFKVLVYFFWYTNFLILQGFIIFHLASYLKIVLLLPKNLFFTYGGWVHFCLWVKSSFLPMEKEFIFYLQIIFFTYGWRVNFLSTNFILY